MINLKECERKPIVTWRKLGNLHKQLQRYLVNDPRFELGTFIILISNSKYSVTIYSKINKNENEIAFRM